MGGPDPWYVDILFELVNVLFEYVVEHAGALIFLFGNVGVRREIILSFDGCNMVCHLRDRRRYVHRPEIVTSE